MDQPKPDCADEKLAPCSTEDWRPCAMCHTMVCQRHSETNQVWHPGEGEYGAYDEICHRCFEVGLEKGEIIVCSYWEYIAR
jgi:hypothetical protein